MSGGGECPRRVLALIVGAAVFSVTIAMRGQILASQDLYLHISIGRWILAHRAVPDHGIFSASMPGAPWLADEWLASLGSALLYDHFGWGGVLAAVALLLAIAIGALTLGTAEALGPIGALCAAILGWGLCINHLVARPHVASLPLLVVWLGANAKARRDDRVPSFYLAPLMTLWANVHGSFMFGLGLTGLLAAEAVFESDTLDKAFAAGLRWSAFLGVSVLAAAITPYGLAGLLFPIRMLGLSPALATVFEWQPSTIVNNAPLLLWCGLLLFVALLYGVRLPICRLIIFMLLLYMAFAHRRHTELLGLATPLLLQPSIAEALSKRMPGFAAHWGTFARPSVNLPLAGASLIAAAAVAFVGCRHVVRGPDIYTPAAALDTVEKCGISGPVLNSQNFGGYLIFRGYNPFIDGRIDLYGNDFMLRYVALDQLTALLEQYRIAWTVFEPNTPRAVVMDNLAGWSKLFADDTAVVHVRNGISSRCPALGRPH